MARKPKFGEVGRPLSELLAPSIVPWTMGVRDAFGDYIAARNRTFHHLNIPLELQHTTANTTNFPPLHPPVCTYSIFIDLRVWCPLCQYTEKITSLSYVNWCDPNEYIKDEFTALKVWWSPTDPQDKHMYDYFLVDPETVVGLTQLELFLPADTPVTL